jgi:hypothetical protein
MTESDLDEYSPQETARRGGVIRFSCGQGEND